MKPGMEEGLGHIVLDWEVPALLPKRDIVPIAAHVCFGQTAGWINMALGTEVYLGPDHAHCVHGDPVPPKGAQQPLPSFRPIYCG